MKNTTPLTLVFLLSAAQLRSEDWPQFRGPNSSGISTSRGLPHLFSAKDGVSWQAELGEGISSPIVVSGRVYNTALTSAARFAVFCHDAASGRQIWKTELPTGSLPRITPPNSHASSTPACDGRHVYVYFSTLGLVAFDCHTGREVWRLPLPRPAYLMDWGAAASPVVHDRKVIFCHDDDLQPYLLAAGAETGNVLWRTPRPDMLAGYAVPVLCQAGGRTDVVVAGTGKLKGYDPDTGREVWTCNTLVRTIMTTPVIRGDRIYVAVQSYGDSKRILKYALLEWLDTNQDGKLAREEVPADFRDKFDGSDKNKDGALQGDELDMAFQHPDNMVGGGSIIQAIRGGGTGDVSRTHLLWNLKNRSPSNLASPLLVGEQLFVVKAGGLSSSFDPATGKAHWELERIRSLGDYYGSPVAADGKIFVAARNGFVVVLAAGPTMKILSKNDMGGEIIATPAIADGRLFIRTREKIYCIAGREAALRGKP